MSLRTVICMKWGTRYGAEYVNRLYRAVRRNLSPDAAAPLRFVCFTDDPTDVMPGVECHPLPPITLPSAIASTPWRKLSVWQAPLHDLTGDVLFLDVDLVITGPLDDLFTYQPGEYCVIHNWTQPKLRVGNTSVFRFPVGRYAEVFDRFERDPQEVLRTFRIEQQYISALIPEQQFWPAPWVISFKHSCLPAFPRNHWVTPPLPDDARIVAFHGKPDPIDALQGKWPAPWWRRLEKKVLPTPWIAQHWTDSCTAG